MRKSRLPKGGENLFQAIKRKSDEAQEKGLDLIKLSIGQPTGCALLSAREAASEAVMSRAETMHEYQDNGSPGVPGFAEDFARFHVKRQFDLINKRDQVAYLPIPGIKAMLGLVELACNLRITGKSVFLTTNPGYPTPADWCRYLGIRYQEPLLGPENSFLLLPESVEDWDWTGLVMVNYPHNPSAQIATKEYWEELCGRCVHYNVRLFNDAAYMALAHDPKCCALADAAIDFPDLSWAEGFSASKLINNGTGWRVGAMVGSPDFIGDIATIKGNSDSGFCAPMAAGVIAAVKSDQKGIEKVRVTYRDRLSKLIGILINRDMRLAVEPGAGFFTLWDLPKKAFGQSIESAEHFNLMMIERTGVVGVHFKDYIRYAVCGDAVDTQLGKIDAAFKKARVSYS